MFPSAWRFDGWLGPLTLQYNRSYFTVPAPPQPPQLVDKGLTNPETAPPDFYCAMDYIPLTLKNYQGNMGNDLLTCPLAIARLNGPIYRMYAGNWGNVEGHYFYSDLMFGDYDKNPLFYRTNIYGPYKGEELTDAAKTAFSGDAVVFSDADPPYTGMSYVFALSFSWGNIGERSTCFGAITTWPGQYTDDPPYTHRMGVNAAFWDGHVENVTPPPISQRNALRPMFTRNGKAAMLP